MRKIPATMVSQHPDHAGIPYWHHKEYISTRHETHECYLSFSEIGVSEYKWDWEGKFVDESVIERLLGEYFSYFQKHPLGKEKFLTFRLPNPNVETEFRLGRAFMGILSAAGLAKQVGLHSPPIFEVILPMTETAEELIDIEEAFHELTNLKHHLYKFSDGMLKHIEVIPLFEKVDTIINSDKILHRYLSIHKQKFGKTPLYMRPYVARSDPALNSGIIPTVLAIKIALSKYRLFEEKYGIQLFPIIGSASLPFRGGLTPYTAEQFINEYQGVKTALIQSAFRYDFPKKDVIKAIKVLEKLLPKGKAKKISTKEEKELVKIMDLFEKVYQPTIEGIADSINAIAHHLPKRRERVQHIGLFGYSRGIGKVKLPRAIGFTGALYSLGIPPEVIGSGRGLKKTIKNGQIDLIEKYYVNLKQNLLRAGKFVNKNILTKKASRSSYWQTILEDVVEIEKYLKVELGPQTQEEIEHSKLVEKIDKKMKEGKNPTELLNQTALLRKSLG